jgi:hypothetical protein
VRACVRCYWRDASLAGRAWRRAAFCECQAYISLTACCCVAAPRHPYSPYNVVVLSHPSESVVSARSCHAYTLRVLAPAVRGVDVQLIDERGVPCTGLDVQSVAIGCADAHGAIQVNIRVRVSAQRLLVRTLRFRCSALAATGVVLLT